MKPAWYTTEFWTMIITSGVGIAMAMGVVNTEQGQEIGNALKAIAGAVITIASALGYMKSRTTVKAAYLSIQASNTMAQKV